MALKLGHALVGENPFNILRENSMLYHRREWDIYAKLRSAGSATGIPQGVPAVFCEVPVFARPLIGSPIDFADCLIGSPINFAECLIGSLIVSQLHCVSCPAPQQPLILPLNAPLGPLGLLHSVFQTV